MQKCSFDLCKAVGILQQKPQPVSGTAEPHWKRAPRYCLPWVEEWGHGTSSTFCCFHICICWHAFRNKSQKTQRNHKDTLLHSKKPRIRQLRGWWTHGWCWPAARLNSVILFGSPFVATSWLNHTNNHGSWRQQLHRYEILSHIRMSKGKEEFRYLSYAAY